MKRILTIAIFILATTLGAMAQSRIDNTIRRVENHSSTQYCAYSERRDPANLKAIRSSRVMVISESDANDVRRAMDRERSRAVSVNMVNGGKVYSLWFLSGGYYKVYTIVRQNNGTWLLTVETLPEEAYNIVSDLDIFMSFFIPIGLEAESLFPEIMPLP